MAIDLPSLVKQALLTLGCSPDLIAELDGHSTITLDFEQLPSLLIARQDDLVWIWSRVADYNEAVVMQRSGELLAELMRGDTSLLGGHPSLTESDGYLEFRALLAPESLENPVAFGIALTLFFDRISHLTRLIR